MEGAEVERLLPDAKGAWGYRRDLTHILMKVETHNHPTAISPFPGASTGAGGEIRQIKRIGQQVITIKAHERIAVKKQCGNTADNHNVVQEIAQETRTCIRGQLQPQQKGKRR